MMQADDTPGFFTDASGTIDYGPSVEDEIRALLSEALCPHISCASGIRFQGNKQTPCDWCERRRKALRAADSAGEPKA